MRAKYTPKTLEAVVPWLVLFLLLTYTFFKMFVSPYLGFQLNRSSGLVNDIFIESSAPPLLHLGDQILSINGLSLEERSSDLRKPFLDINESNHIMEIQFLRNGKTETIEWLPLGFTANEFLSRLINIWPAGYVFWLMGTIVMLLVRPKDIRRALMASFFFVTSIWIVAGAFSGLRILEVGFVMRAAFWMCLPIYVHFHWNFPRMLRQSPNYVWGGLYLLGITGAILQWLSILPRDFFYWPFTIAVLLSVFTLMVRFIIRPIERGELKLLFLAALVAFLPALVIVLSIAQQSITRSMPGLIFSMISLPGAYFYVVYRRQLGGLELRANRLISLYLYLVILLTLIFALLPAATSYLDSVQSSTGIIAVLVLFTALSTVLGFNRFQRFVERRLLNIPLTPEHLLETFSRKIATSITPEHLAAVLRDEVLPSLLIRQSALIQLADDLTPEILYSEGVDHVHPPEEQDIHRLLEQSGKSFKPVANPSKLSKATDWVQLSLPLVIGERITGIWLLGRRDPDDHYSHAATLVLTSLADQTAIALTNIAQAKQLRALYQTDIERQELERTHLARELHDDVLNRFAELKIQLGEQAPTSKFETNYQQLVDYLRATIHGLRPPMLSYGLHAGLNELVDELSYRSETTAAIQLDVPVSQSRVDKKIEQHLYRIVQQSLENALQHAQAKNVTISGIIDESHIDLIVQDDGQGFDLDQGIDLVALLSNRHFGLASMSERAALVGADLNITTTIGKGTKIGIHWAQ
jgi:signal transduction histidine kinase